MQEHNLSLIPIIVAEDSRKIERNKESRNLMAMRGSDEVPMVLFHSGSLILNKPPTTLITIANIKAIKVKVRLHTLNKLLRIPFECTSDCFLGVLRFLATGLFTSTFRRITSLFGDATMTPLSMTSL